MTLRSKALGFSSIHIPKPAFVACAVVWSSGSRVDCAAALREFHERRGTEDGSVQDAITRPAARACYPLRRQQHSRLSTLPVSSYADTVTVSYFLQWSFGDNKLLNGILLVLLLRFNF